MNKKNLFICNTVYQVLVANWIKYTYHSDEQSDIIITNHMNGYESIAERIRNTNIFDNVYTTESINFALRNERIYKNKLHKYLCCRFPNIELKHYIELKDKYDRLFVANIDSFIELLFDTLKRKNKNLELNYFEDGLSTYSKITEGYYHCSCEYGNKFRRFVFKNIFHKKYLYGAIDRFLLFHRELLEWDTGCDVVEIRKIDKNDENFKEIVNKIFLYDSLVDSYDEKYIFFEESFFADTGYMEDVELVEKIAEIVGRENMLIKIHPRNPVNRFSQRGFKTNVDTAIPWEVIAMNKDISDKVLIAIASASMVNPVLIFNIPTKAYSLLNLLNERPSILHGDLFKTTMNFYKNHNKNIRIVSKIEDVLS